MSVKTKFRFLFIVIILAVAFFTTCESPMGMGDSIDWEPPVLILDPIPNPYYVKPGTVLSGTATDNVGVVKIDFLDPNGRSLFPVERSGNRFKIILNFPPEYDGEKIVAEIRAYDLMGNSGGTATAFATLYIDNTPPIMEHIEIKRTDTKITMLEPYADLKAIEGIPERKENLIRHQNGWFYINAVVADKETRVQDSKLEIYDSRDPNKMLVSLDYDAADGYTPYFPRWTVKEEDIINAGEAAFPGTSYKSNYYNNNAYYYYRVTVKSMDMSENYTRQEDYGWMCLWANSDKPRGIVDPTVLSVKEEGDIAIVSKNTSLPVEFYDDDSLYWAYTGLIKEAQWGVNGLAGTAAGGASAVTATGSDIDKLRWLKGILTGNTGTNPGDVTLGTPGSFNDWAGKAITNQITGNIDEKLVYLATGNSDNDYGNYILFTITADKKLAPGNGTGPEWTNKGVWDYKIVKINLKNENAPLIVFDTKAGSPEENTFPQKLVNNKFTIYGYTLRENGNGETFNKITTFRMAWIPSKIPGGHGEANVKAVQEALKKSDFAGMPAGVQYWEFTETGTVTGQDKALPLKISGSDSLGAPYGYKYQLENDTDKDKYYTRQGFEKTFDVMGGQDDIKNSYNNFTYNGVFENETKLFIFYAKDNMTNEVFRQLPILGFKSVPKMEIYDITYNVAATSLPSGIPNLSADGNFDDKTGAPSRKYYDDLNTYNQNSAVKDWLYNNRLPLTASVSFQQYPRLTTVKYWVDASNNKIPIKTLTMKDITYAEKDADMDWNPQPDGSPNNKGRVPVGSGFNSDKTFSFIEYYPDVTQRTFLFEAEDMLGNKASVQRTIAISNAARLESITTTAQNGTYGHGKTIVLQANFSSQIYVAKEDGKGLTNVSEKPILNIRYKLKGSAGYKYDDIRCDSVSQGANPSTDPYGLLNPSISLSFSFTVPENADGDLETIYNEIKDFVDQHDRPITLPSGTKIMDNARKDDAFIPGYSTKTITMPNWTEDTHKSLQKSKKITLDGVHPEITSIGLDPSVKAAYTTTPLERYFKTGESITLVITADKPIRALGNSRLKYIIQPKTGDSQTFDAAFKYQRPVTNNPYQLVYSLKVDQTTCPIDGELVRVELYQNGADSDIVDNWDNNIKVVLQHNLLRDYNDVGKIYIKQTLPVKPAATLSNTDSSTVSEPLETVTRTNFKGTVNLGIPDSSAVAWSEWEDRKQYSINGGSTWLPTPLEGTNGTKTYAIATPGTHNIQVRYLDRAGNEGIVAKRTIVIGDTFPALVSVGTVEPNGWYISGKSLTFNLNFADTVTVSSTAQANLSITLKNRKDTTTGDNEKTIYTNMGQGDGGTTITFKWDNVNGTEMQDGVYISNVVLTGLTDKFGIQGSTGSATCTAAGVPSVISPNSCPNLAAGIKVDGIAPTITGTTPAHNVPPTDNTLVKTITLKFREPVIKGSGVITIRPRGTYAIPPVFDDQGYYLGYNTSATAESADGTGTIPTKYTSAGTARNRTYVSGFYDIYNNSALNATDRGYLLKGKSMSDHDLNDRTGRSAGPYIKTTQGLIAGRGYSGMFDGANITNGVNSPDTATGYMIPDTATKWVLDYKYTITENNTAIINIRNTLTKAKFRWQEYDVANTSVDIGTGANSNTVTITLDEPLLKGLDWDVYYPAGTFTDEAGNPAAGSGYNTSGVMTPANVTYYFTSPGVQAPVIRVNRRSYDSRTSNWKTNPTSGDGSGVYGDPANTATWNASTQVDDNNGWGIQNFNTVHFRVESESQNLTQMQVGTYKGLPTNQGAVTADWSGNVQTSTLNNGATLRTNMTWDQAASNTVGTWVLSNLIRRSRDNTNQTYRVITKAGIEESRTSTTNDNNNKLRMFRSYNKDLNATGLDGISLANQSNGYQGILTFTALEANKSYIAASATKNGQTVKGYEGVFRTVIALNFSANKGNNFLLIEGSNIKNGIPSVAGFPVRDAEEDGDRRFIKVFYNQTTNGTTGTNEGTTLTNTRTRFYWVSTEIVCEWYFLYYGGGSSHQSVGEVNNYLTVGYGDLTYAYNLTTY